MDKKTARRIARQKRLNRIKKKIGKFSNLLKAIVFTFLGILCTFEQQDYKAFIAFMVLFAIIKTWRS